MVMRKTEHTVKIQVVDNGFIAQVGCKTFVFPCGEIDTMLGDLRELLINGDRKLREKYLPGEENFPQEDQSFAPPCDIQAQECAPTTQRY
jgi:hypothetical protein